MSWWGGTAPRCHPTSCFSESNGDRQTEPPGGWLSWTGEARLSGGRDNEYE